MEEVPSEAAKGYKTQVIKKVWSFHISLSLSLSLTLPPSLLPPSLLPSPSFTPSFCVTIILLSSLQTLQPEWNETLEFTVSIGTLLIGE